MDANAQIFAGRICTKCAAIGYLAKTEEDDS